MPEENRYVFYEVITQLGEVEGSDSLEDFGQEGVRKILRRPLEEKLAKLKKDFKEKFGGLEQKSI